MSQRATKNLQQWNSQDKYVERNMDNAPFTTAHSDNTLVLAGPPRHSAITQDGAEGNIFEQMLPLGMLQNFSYNASRNTAPVQTIGTARTFFTSSKAQVGFSMSRLLVNGRNLLRALYHSAVYTDRQTDSGVLEKLVNDNKTGGGHAGAAYDQYFINFDSKLFYVPFGLAFIQRSIADDIVGGGYIELCMLSSFNSGIRAGRSMVMENVQGVSDRIKPLNRLDSFINAGGTSGGYVEADQGGTDRENDHRAQESVDIERTFLDLGSDELSTTG